MCDAVEGCPCRVDAYCFTRAYSMAAVLFESVNGNRYMVGNGRESVVIQYRGLRYEESFRQKLM